jgi:hypothetical protein
LGIGTWFKAASEDEYFSGEEPVDHGDGLGCAVVAGDGDIDEFEWAVGSAEGDGWDVDVRCLKDGLFVLCVIAKWLGTWMGSVTIRRRGSWNLPFWLAWLVRVPGVHLLDLVEIAPV